MFSVFHKVFIIIFDEIKHLLFVLHDDREKERSVFLTILPRQVIASISDLKIFWLDLPQMISFEEFLVDKWTKWLHQVKSERFTLVPCAMVDAIVVVKAIESQERFYEVKEIGVADVKQEVGDVVLGSGFSTCPTNRVKVRLKIDFCHISFKSQKGFIVFLEWDFYDELFYLSNLFPEFIIFFTDRFEHIKLTFGFDFDDFFGNFEHLIFGLFILFFPEDDISFGLVSNYKVGEKIGFHQHQRHSKLLKFSDNDTRKSGFTHQKYAKSFVHGDFIFDDTFLFDNEIFIVKAYIFCIITLDKYDELFFKVRILEHGEYG